MTQASDDAQSPPVTPTREPRVPQEPTLQPRANSVPLVTQLDSPLSPSESPGLRLRQRVDLRVQTDFSEAATTSDGLPRANASPKTATPSPRTAGANGNSPATRVAVAAAADFRLSDFFYKEIFGVHDIKQTDGMHQERVQNFLVVPYNIEQVIYVSFSYCALLID